MIGLCAGAGNETGWGGGVPVGIPERFHPWMSWKAFRAGYDDAHPLTSFAKNPEPAGTLLHWVCRDKIAYLDLTYDRLDLNPA